MIDSINDTPHDAAALAELLRGRLAHVNLIPMNPVAHTPWRPELDRTARRHSRRCLRNAGHRDDCAAQPRHRHRRGVRPARRGARRRARPGGRSRAGASCSSSNRPRRWSTRQQPQSARPDAARWATRSQVAASILTADFGHLYRVVRKLERAGVDRLHLDVMDGHFVPNITFGPDVVAAIRRLSRRCPSTSHLMISEPARYMDRFLAAGADTLTFHVEVAASDESKRATLAHDPRRAARRRPGGQPGHPDRRAVRHYLDELGHHHGHDRRARLRRAAFHAPSRRRRSPRRAACSASGRDTAVHVDGGVSADTAGIVGAYGVDVCVVGSALFQRGRDTAVRGRTRSRRRDARRGRRPLSFDARITERCGCCCSASRVPRSVSSGRCCRRDRPGPAGPGGRRPRRHGRDRRERWPSKAVDLRIFRDDGGQDEPVAHGRRRRCPGGQPVHAFRRHAQGTPAVIPRRGRAGSGKRAVRGVLRRRSRSAE